MKIIGSLLFVVCFLSACGQKTDHKGKTPLIEVAGEFLYREDLQSVLPDDLSKDDSLLFAEHYIRNWIEETLLYNKAESNIPDNDRLEKLVENYRRSLILHAYQQELIEQKLKEKIPDEEIDKYYEEHKKLFVLEYPLLKGLFMKVPLKSPELNQVRVWYKKNTPDAIEKLEKYSLRNAVIYDYFYDRWIPATEVMDKIPLSLSNSEKSLKEIGHVEVKDSAYYYFLNISDYLDTGEQEPLEFARNEIKDILLNLKRVDFMRKVKNDLYNDAVDRKKIVYY